jgi:hypothetical protein
MSIGARGANRADRRGVAQHTCIIYHHWLRRNLAALTRNVCALQQLLPIDGCVFEMK